MPEARAYEEQTPFSPPRTLHGGFFNSRTPSKGAGMANHLTPDELSKEYGMKREDVIRLCHEQSVPIYHGKIDKSLFQAVREELALVR
jgi:hypothetical protein